MSYNGYNSTPLKILHIISGDLWAGAEVQMYQTLAHLRRDNNLTLECILFNEGILRDKIERLDIKVIVMDEARFNSFRLLPKLVKTLRAKKPDIVHVHRTKEHFLCKLSLILIREEWLIVRTVHGAKSSSTGLPFFRRIKANVVNALDDFMLRYHSNAVIAVSKDLESILIRQGCAKRICQVNNAVDINSLLNIKFDRNAIRKRFGVNHEIWIGTAARLVEVKNIPMLIATGKHLQAHGSHFKISIFGAGPLKNELHKAIINAGLKDKVVLHGFEPDILPIIGSLDIFVLTSQHEGLPMSLLEAMALKIPVICTNVGGMAEIINNGVNGLLVSPNDSKALFDAIVSLSQSAGLASDLVRNASETIEHKYSFAATGHQLKNIYSGLTAARKGKV